MLSVTVQAAAHAQNVGVAPAIKPRTTSRLSLCPPDNTKAATKISGTSVMSTFLRQLLAKLICLTARRCYPLSGPLSNVRIAAQNGNGARTTSGVRTAGLLRAGG